MKNKFLKPALVFCFGLMLFITPILAQEPTSSPVSEDEVKEKIKERLEQVVDEDLEKTKEELTKKAYAWVGIVQSIEDKSLLIKTAADEKRAKIDNEAHIYKVVTGKGRTSIKFEDIEEDQYCIAMGFKEEEEIILTKRVIVLDEAPTATKRDLISGKVEEVDVDEKEVTVQKNGEASTINLGKAKLKISGIKSPTVEDIQIGDYLTAVVTLDKNDKIDAVKVVLIIPGETNPQAVENEVTEPEAESSAANSETEEKTPEESED